MQTKQTKQTKMLSNDDFAKAIIRHAPADTFLRLGEAAVSRGVVVWAMAMENKQNAIVHLAIAQTEDEVERAFARWQDFGAMTRKEARAHAGAAKVIPITQGPPDEEKETVN